MPKTFLRTVLVQNRTEGSDRTFQEDLPVNPLSVILITLRAQSTGALLSTTIRQMFTMMTSVGVMFRGQDVIRGSLADLAFLNACATGWLPFGKRVGIADDAVFSLTVPLCFGRKPYDAMECFPSTRRGDLVLEATVDVAVTGADGLSLQIETVEMLDAVPRQFLKYTTIANTFASTGQEAVRLPIGNPFLGALLFGTTVPTAATRTATFDQFRIKVDNVEYGYARTNWESVHGEMNRRWHGSDEFLVDHLHAGTYVTTVESESEGPSSMAGLFESYGYVDYDPMGDGEYAIDTAGRADVVLQRDSGTADAGRILPVELVRVQGGPAGA